MKYTEFEAGKIYRCVASETRNMLAGTIVFIVEVKATNPDLKPASRYSAPWGGPGAGCNGYYDLHETVPSHDKHGYKQVTEVVACDVDDMATKKPESMILRNARWVICESE